MKILWFEVSEPSAYLSGGIPVGGWQDSLERIVKSIPDLELTIAFVSEKHSAAKVIEGVTYVPIFTQWSLYEKRIRKYWDVYVEKMLPSAKRIIDEYRPDLIHVFGTEWPFGQIASYTDIPLVIHIMGAIVPYHNANYPPGYSFIGEFVKSWWNPMKCYGLWKSRRDNDNWLMWERRTWKLVNNYMGRTHWDKSLSNVMHPGRKYFHVEEALRTVFLQRENIWKLPEDGKLKLVSTGCSSFWKGPDMMLKVAKILINLNVDFEWLVVGKMNPYIKKTIEKQEGVCFEDMQINILGFKNPDELMKILCSSTMYVHTAYIENSPNSICEAQCLGLPVVSTNVGGIASLVRQDMDGILVAANDPWQMADAIIELYNDRERMQRYSQNAQTFALNRHHDEHIKEQLLDCYNQLVCKCPK